MNALALLDDYCNEATTFAGMGSIQAVNELIDQYVEIKQQIIDLHGRVMGERYGAAFSYFVSAIGQNSLSELMRVERFFELQRALCALDQDFWNRLLDVINVRNFMPAETRERWHDDLDEWRKADRHSFSKVKPIAFDRETVLITAKRLSDERKDFFSEMVDGVFRKLSPSHFTNKAEGFSKRMIVANVMPSIDRHYDNQQYINDLRKVIGLLLGREGAEQIESYELLNNLKSYYGEWIPIDDDTVSLKAHKNGTVHVEISPEIADALNAVLAYRYPNVIPLKKQRGQKIRNPHFLRDMTYKLTSVILPYHVCSVFGELSKKSRSAKVGGNGDLLYHFTQPGNYRYSEATNECVGNIIRLIGGVEDESRKGNFVFNFDPVSVFEYLFINGTLPDENSHQFYPTKGEVRKRATDLAEIRPGHTLLEPSAGFGDLLALLPKGVDVTAIDVHPLAAAVLHAKGYKDIRRDFLAFNAGDLPLFDRILMNPPYSSSRWKHHLQHAVQFLKPGGKMVAVLPCSVASEELSECIGNGFDVSCSAPYPKGFEGTNINVTIVTVDRHE